MPERYPHFWGGSQICSQSAPPVKATYGEKLKMLNCKFACISDPAANTMQTAVQRKHTKRSNFQRRVQPSTLIPAKNILDPDVI